MKTKNVNETPVKFAADDSYVCQLADRLESTMREAYNSEVALSAALFSELRSLMKQRGLDASFTKYTVAREKYANELYFATEKNGGEIPSSEQFTMVLPAPPQAVKELALDFKRAAKLAAGKYGYQAQWIQKSLMAMDDELFRERAVREDAGKTKHPKFRQEQIEYVGKIAKRLRLTSEQIEALIHALA